MKISIIIPTYEMQGKGVQMLDELLQSIRKQTYTDYEIIISDNSQDNVIEQYTNDAAYCYYRNEKKHSPAANLNNALKYATGDIIKPMMQDDYFTDVDCLQQFATMTKQWAVCTSKHTQYYGDHVPYENNDILDLVTGCNTYGSPSAVAWKRNELRFDEHLLWLVDCDFYAQMIKQYGQPEFINTSVNIRIWNGQMTNTMAVGNVRVEETNYVIKKWA